MRGASEAATPQTERQRYITVFGVVRLRETAEKGYLEADQCNFSNQNCIQQLVN
jgi:hypothetical protein